MRKLMWCSIGFALACGLWVCVLPEGWMLPLILFGIAAAMTGIPVKSVRRVSLAGLGLALGLIWCAIYQQFYLSSAVAVDGTQVETTVTVTDYSYETTYGSAVDGTVELEGKTFHIRIYLNDLQELKPGDTVSGTFRMRYTPGGEESATYHPGKGIFLLGYQRGEVVVCRTEEAAFSAAKLAKSIKDTLRRLFPEDVFPFAQALLLGDSSELDYETETAFKLSGIRHIIAVSGLHVTILYSLLSALTFKNRYLTALVSFPTLLLFAAVAGFTPSVTRACIMVGLMILAQLSNMEYDSPTALAFAVLVMLVVNPMVITSVSFQLSAGCVAGIQMFSTPVGDWLKSKIGEIKGRGVVPVLKRWYGSSVSVSLSAMSLTTPLCAYYFGAVSLVGVVTNLVTLWVVNFIFNGLVAVCLLSLIWVKAAEALAWVIAWPIRFVLWVSKLLASLPLAAVYTKSPYIVAWLVFVYVLLAVFLLSDKRKPFMLGCCAAIGICVALLVSWLEPLSDDLRVTVLDVGQGQSILLQTEGKTFLVDCGGESDERTADTVAETLLSQGISRLDGVIITHCDTDHVGGLESLLTRVDADIILYPITDQLTLEGENLYAVSEDLELAAGAAKITVFAPIYASDSNENSLCVLFNAEDCDILITGDRGSLGESVLLSGHDLPDVELLIAGHHGSKYSTTEALLDAVRPEIIFVSAGADNSYGHPAQEMLDRAAAVGAAVYRTDLHGTLVFRR